MSLEEKEEQGASQKDDESVLPVDKAAAPIVHAGIILKSSHLVLITLLAVCTLVGGVFLGMWIKDQNTDPDLDPNAKDYGDIYFGEAVEEGNISAPGYSEISFPANTRKVQMILPNPQGNPCYFRFSLVLKETGETLYQSGLIAPGMAVDELTLSRPLSAGSYLLLIQIDTASLENRSAMNSINMEVALTVR